MLKDTIRYVIVRSGISLLSLGSLVLILHLLGPAESGKMTLVIVLVQGLAPLVSLGTDAALARYVVKAGRQLSRDLYRQALTFLLGGVGLTVGLLLLANQFNLLPTEVSGVLILIFSLIVCYGLNVVNIFLLRGAGKLNLTSVLDGLNEVAPRILALPLLLLVGSFYNIYLLVQLGVAIFVLLLSSWLVRRAFKRWPTAELELPHAEQSGKSQLEVVDLTKTEALQGYRLYSSMSWANNLVLLFYNNVSLWMLRYLLSPYEVGLFGLASRIPTMLIGLVLVPLNVPLLYHFTATEARQQRTAELIQGVVFLSAIMGCASLFLGGTADWLVPHLFGPDFSGAVPALIIYAQVPFIMAYQSLLNPLMTSQNRLQLVNLMAVLHIICSSIISLLLIPVLGVAAASLAIAVAHVVVGLVYTACARLVVPGLFKTLIYLYLVYLPFGLLAALHLWFIAVPGYLAGLLLLGLLDRRFIARLFASVRPKLSKTQELAKAESARVIEAGKVNP